MRDKRINSVMFRN